jgi:Domain of unknown function (DUF3883)
VNNNPNDLAIIVAFYLSKFDKEALKNLGFKSSNDAFEKIGGKLGVKKNYIKFRRDEFDPVHQWRKGWQREMDGRIIKAIEALQDLEEKDLRDIVEQILGNSEYRESDEINQIISIFSEQKKDGKSLSKYVLRGPTGRAAEEWFMNNYLLIKKPIEGELIDCRDFGVGYDFKITAEKLQYYIEVKGISDIAGGILLTSKEWKVAKDEGSSYYLCIISNLNDKPKVIFIQNPFEKLVPKRNIFTSIQISWSLTAKQLKEFDD